MGTGTVAFTCQIEITDKCAGKDHGNRAMRSSLESNRSSLSDACMERSIVRAVAAYAIATSDGHFATFKNAIRDRPAPITRAAMMESCP